jgi:hypothetical protein
VSKHHPFFHAFDVHVNDEIIEANAGKVPIVIKRWERCDCGTVRTHILSLITMTKSGYQYPERPKEIDRATREEWTEAEFYAHTDLPRSVVAKIKKLRS